MSTESYFNQVFLLSYATTEVGVPAQSMLLITAICSAVTIGLVVTADRLADRIGNRMVFLVGIAGLTLLAFPTFLVVNTGSFEGILGIRLVGTVFAAAVYAPIAAILASSFSVNVRYTGVSLGYQVAAFLGGGFAPVHRPGTAHRDRHVDGHRRLLRRRVPDQFRLDAPGRCSGEGERRPGGPTQHRRSLTTLTLH